jgi:hypothetical protein
MGGMPQLNWWNHKHTTHLNLIFHFSRKNHGLLLGLHNKNWFDVRRDGCCSTDLLAPTNCVNYRTIGKTSKIKRPAKRFFALKTESIQGGIAALKGSQDF